MDNEKDQQAEKESSTQAVLERGKKAIEAEEKINKKDPESPQGKIEKEKDEEQWRNEG